MQSTKQEKIQDTATQDGIWLVVYDLDKTLTIRHTGGDEEIKSFEKPNWRRNLRCPETLRIHMAKMKKHCQLSIGTFGWCKERVEGYRKELWLEPEECLYHAEFVNTEIFSRLGKNGHICELIKQHYEQPNAAKIIGVLLVEDDRNNIKCLNHFKEYVQKKYPDDPRFDVQLDGVLIKRAQYVMRTEPGCEFEFPVEHFYTLFELQKSLKLIENKLIPGITLENDLSSSSEDSHTELMPLSVFDTYQRRARLTSSMGCGYESARDPITPPPIEERNFLMKSK